MYSIDKDTRIIALNDPPTQNVGAPMPRVVATDDKLLLAYETAPTGDEVAVLSFFRPYAHSFGSPNDEALAVSENEAMREASRSIP
jgi:hypothetical protein